MNDSTDEAFWDWIRDWPGEDLTKRVYDQNANPLPDPRNSIIPAILDELNG